MTPRCHRSGRWRPTDFTRSPAEVQSYLDADQARLYEMIWKRAIASQMQPAEIERTTVEIEAVNGARRATLRGRLELWRGLSLMNEVDGLGLSNGRATFSLRLR